MGGQVTAQEAHLLNVARSALGISVPADWSRLLAASITPPPKLGPTARGVLQDTLARGSVLALARHGGWPARATGRLWERAPAPALHFTGNIIRLLQWVLKTPLGEHETSALVLERPFTPAEELFVVLLLQRLKGHAGEHTVARQSAVRASALVMLAHAGTLAAAHSLPNTLPTLRLEEHAVYVAGLRDLMARSWAADEAAKGLTERPEQLIRVGEAQRAVIASFFAGINGSLEMRGLAGFLIDAAASWLSHKRTAADYTAVINPAAPLRERVEARRAAGSMMRSMAQLHAWDAEHRSMHFLDDAFAQGQALVREWSALGETGFRDAAALVSELDAL